MKNFFIKTEELTDKWGNSRTVKTVRKERVALCAILVLFLLITVLNSFTHLNKSFHVKCAIYIQRTVWNSSKTAV